MPHRPLPTLSVAALVTCLTFLALPAPGRALEIPARFTGKLHSCPVAGEAGGTGEGLCGSYEVFENREARSGRKIAIQILVLPATGPNPAPDPIFYLSGGPGEAAVGGAEEFLPSPLRTRRDIVLVDTRGTGGSNGLYCQLWGDGSRLDHVFPLDAALACRDTLEKRADLTLYTTAASVDDVDEVRRYLGYGPVNLFGGSYGTYSSQIFLVRHPEAVRSVFLTGVVKPGGPYPLYHARNAEHALSLLARDCAAEPACHAAFPNFRKEVSEVLDRLARKPLRVKVKPSETAQPVEVELTRSAAADTLRWALYNPRRSSSLPLLVHQAAQGDYQALATGTVQIRAALQKELALGLLFSVACAEDLSRIDPKTIPVATKGTFYGDDRVKEQLAICGIWPHAPLPPGSGDLIHSDVPVLLLSGERDPVTPPADAAEVAKGFSHGLWVLIPHGTHNGGGDCEDRVIGDFFERGSVQGLDVACLKAAKPAPFVTKAP
jgi:pimeloyl-ACP methyl ester carboxylesterase